MRISTDGKYFKILYQTEIVEGNNTITTLKISTDSIKQNKISVNSMINLWKS